MEGPEELSQYLYSYQVLGISTIPLRPGSKIAALSNWPLVDSEEQWRFAPMDANLGIRMGDYSKIAVLDCDSQTTFMKVLSIFSGKGLYPRDFPTVVTASGTGRHIYFTFEGSLLGAYKLIKDEIGRGEFRYGSNAYAVAPPSVISGNTYQLETGDFGSLPVLSLQDIEPLIKIESDLSLQKRRVNSDTLQIPRLAANLLKDPEYWRKINRYQSRSEAEQAIITSLVNWGATSDEIFELFITSPGPGKFSQMISEGKGARALTYLTTSLKNATTFSKRVSRPRQIAFECIQWADNRSWPGQSGSYDRSVYLAHAFISFQAGKSFYVAAARTLAEIARCHRRTASKATGRLIDQGLIKLEKTAVIPLGLANVYSLVPPKMHIVPTSSQLFEGVGTVCTFHEVFSRSPGLGFTAGEIWKLLGKNAKTPKELAMASGRHVSTIRRNIKLMERVVDPHTGELISIVTKKGRKWERVEEIDLDHIANCRGVFGYDQKKKSKHERERLAFQRMGERREVTQKEGKKR